MIVYDNLEKGTDLVPEILLYLRFVVHSKV